MPPSDATFEIARLTARVETLERERKHLVTLVELLREIVGAVHYVDVAQAVARRLGNTFGLDRCSVFLTERGGGTVHLVASFEDPTIRNHVVDLGRYPELRRALETGRIVHIPNAADDPSLAGVAGTLQGRRVRSIAVVPMSWRGAVIGAIFLRTFKDGPEVTDADLEFSRVVAEVTARALRLAHRFERMQQRRRGDLASDRERAALTVYLRRLLDACAEGDDAWEEGLLAQASVNEIDRLVDVTMTVLSSEASPR